MQWISNIIEWYSIKFVNKYTVHKINPDIFLFKETIMKRFKERLLHCSPKLDSLKIELSDLTSNSVPIEVREKVDPMFCRLEWACSTLVALSYTTAGGFFFSSSSSLVCSREEKSIPEVDISSKVPLPRHFPCADTFMFTRHET